MSAIVEVKEFGRIEITDDRIRVTSAIPKFGELVRVLTEMYEPAGLLTTDHPDNHMANWLAEWLQGEVTQRTPWTLEPDPSQPLVIRMPAAAKEWDDSTFKGGPGSGNFDHAGRPGKVGGSRPTKAGRGEFRQPGARRDTEKHPAKPKDRVFRAQNYQMMIRDKVRAKFPFAMEKWSKLSVPDRIGEWAKLSEEDRDNYANASKVVPHAIQQIVKTLGERPKPAGGNFSAALSARVDQASELVHRESASRIKKTLGDFDGVLGKLGLAGDIRHQMGMEAADALIAQEHEAMARQLGDHGIHHIGANIETALKMVESLPGAHSSRAVAAVYIAQIFHDTGYLTDPARLLMDNGHPRWGAEHYDANVRKLAAAVVGERWARQITTMIADHAGSNIDWENDAVGSAIRLADNLAVYHREKLPPLFRHVDGTRKVLLDLHHKRISLDEARTRMREKVAAMQFAKPMETALLRAVDEVNERTGAFTLGMLGGYLQDVRWTGDRMKVEIQRNKKMDVMHNILDLGQKQAGKFVKSFDKDPTTFLESGHEEIVNPKTGKVMIEFEMIGFKERRAQR